MSVKSFIVQFLKLLSLSFLDLAPSKSETLKLLYSKTWQKSIVVATGSDNHTKSQCYCFNYARKKFYSAVP